MKCFLIPFFLFVFTNTFSQNSDSLKIDNVNVEIDSSKVDSKASIGRQLVLDGKQIVNNIFHSYTRPIYWKKDNWLDFGGVALGTVLLYSVDNDTSRFFMKQGEKAPEVLKSFGYYFGSPQNNYGITSAVYLTGLFTKNEKIRNTGVLMISSATTAGVLQTFMKTLVGRARPGAGEGKFYFKPFSGQPAYRSFPSGHTILVSTTMFALAKQFENPWVKAGIYTVGAITPVSRMWDGAHFFSDVFLSAAISYFVVEGTYRYMNHYDDKKSQKMVNWKVSASPNMLGLTGVF
ncbi:phosphatase PAP2 family protein [Epilithonimonas hispanica]|uniref:Phosphoesterase n=1 Tax=Epilithonimonas hispanica TaxID=358687 RepID=A0A3D9CU07_9FLAO|nr:phosphatase PAP2 family protein [Epilithonimonas hispanica]REC69107.1 phosphoesterase [Epilithonimonas hispanica]